MSRRPQPGPAAFETYSTWAPAATSVLLCRNRSSYFYRASPVTHFRFSFLCFLISPYISPLNQLLDTGRVSWLTTRRHFCVLSLLCDVAVHFHLRNSGCRRFQLLHSRRNRTAIARPIIKHLDYTLHQHREVYQPPIQDLIRANIYRTEWSNTGGSLMLHMSISQ